MSKIDYLKQPAYIPTQWLVGVILFFVSLLGGAVYVGLWVGGIQDNVSANEASITKVETDSKVIQQRVADKLDSIDQRLSHIEGAIGGAIGGARR